MPSKAAPNSTPAIGAATRTAIEAAAIRWRELAKQIAYARSQDPTRGDISPRGELTRAYIAATKELEELVDAAIAAGE